MIILFNIPKLIVFREMIKDPIVEIETRKKKKLWRKIEKSVHLFYIKILPSSPISTPTSLVSRGANFYTPVSNEHVRHAFILLFILIFALLGSANFTCLCPYRLFNLFSKKIKIKIKHWRDWKIIRFNKTLLTFNWS